MIGSEIRAFINRMSYWKNLTVLLTPVAILVFNSGWFLLVYHAGPAFGPTLLAPPAP